MEGEATKRWSPWPLGIALGLGTVVAVHVVLIRAALDSAPVLEAHDAYQQGLDHQQVIDERNSAVALGWTVRAEACTQYAADRCELVLEVLDRRGDPVAGLTGTVDVSRADDAALDRQATVEERAERGYGAPLPLARGGLYRVRMRLAADDRRWVGERRIWFPAPAS